MTEQDMDTAELSRHEIETRAAYWKGVEAGIRWAEKKAAAQAEAEYQREFGMGADDPDERAGF